MDDPQKLVQQQLTRYLLPNLEWRVSIQEFINHYTGEKGGWTAHVKDNSPTIDLYDEAGNQVEKLAFSPIGSYSTETETWLWAWANPAFSPLITRRAENIRKFGSKYGIDQLTMPEMITSEQNLEQYNILASAVYGATKPVIFLPSSETHQLAVLIEDELELPEMTKETFIETLQIAQEMSQLKEWDVDIESAVKQYAEQRGFSFLRNQTNL